MNTSKEIKLIKDESSQIIIDTVESMVTEYGADGVNVKMVLNRLGITNRVFYNRFHNIDEVLEIVYRNMVTKMHDCIASFDPEKDFFTQVTDFVVSTLERSYDTKMKFNQYVFESDSVSRSNYEWWLSEIKKLITFAINKGIMKELDPDVTSYAVWCFCRGYNADAVARGLPKDVAIRNFKYSFGIFLDGMRKR